VQGYVYYQCLSTLFNSDGKHVNKTYISRVTGEEDTVLTDSSDID